MKNGKMNLHERKQEAFRMVLSGRGTWREIEKIEKMIEFGGKNF